eukprot:IDg8113t1
MCATGIAADAIYDYVRMSAASTLQALKEFFVALFEEIGDEYLRVSTADDMERILRINAARGFPGMAGSIDCQHYYLKNCPTRLAGNTRGRRRSRQILWRVLRTASFGSGLYSMGFLAR